MSFASMLRHTCTVQKCTYTQNATTLEMGESWANYATGVKCLINAYSGGRKDQRDDVVYSITHVMFVETLSYLNWKEYRIVYGSDTYTIVGIEDAGGQSHHQELFLSLVK